MGLVLSLFENLETGHVGQAKIEHDAVVCVALERLKGGGAGVDYIDIDVVMPQQFAGAQLLGRIVFDDQQPLAARLRVLADACQCRVQVLG